MDGVVQDAAHDVDEVPRPPEVSAAGRILGPGCYLVEMRLARPAGPDVVVEGAYRMGFRDVLVDQEPERCGEDGRSVARFAGTLEHPILARDTRDIAWIAASRVGIDLGSDLREKTEPFRLLRGTLYELRLVSRMKAQPNRAAFEECLTGMGFRIESVIALKRDMRVRGKPSTSATLWYGRATWERAHSYIGSEEPFYFEDVVEAETESSRQPAASSRQEESET